MTEVEASPQWEPEREKERYEAPKLTAPPRPKSAFEVRAHGPLLSPDLARYIAFLGRIRRLSLLQIYMTALWLVWEGAGAAVGEPMLTAPPRLQYA